MARVSPSQPGDPTITNGGGCDSRTVRPFPSHIFRGQRCHPHFRPPPLTTSSSAIDPAVAHIIGRPRCWSPTLLVAHVVVCSRRHFHRYRCRYHCRYCCRYSCRSCCHFLVDCCMWKPPPPPPSFITSFDDIVLPPWALALDNADSHQANARRSSDC